MTCPTTAVIAAMINAGANPGQPPQHLQIPENLDDLCSQAAGKQLPTPRRQLVELIRRAGFADLHDTNYQDFAKSADDRFLYLYPNAIDAQHKGTYLISVPANEKGLFDQAIDTLRFDNSLATDQLLGQDHWKMTYGTLGTLLGLGVDLAAMVIGYAAGMHGSLTVSKALLLIPAPLAGAIVLPKVMRRRHERKALEARAVLDGYVTKAQYAERPYDSAIIREALRG